MTTMTTTSYLMCSMTSSSYTFYLLCFMTTPSSTSSFSSLMSSMSCKSKKPRKVRQKKKKNWGWQLSSWQMFFFGGGKCPNLGVVNVRILGVVNVLLANDSQSTNMRYGSILQDQTQTKLIPVLYQIWKKLNTGLNIRKSLIPSWAGVYVILEAVKARKPSHVSLRVFLTTKESFKIWE